MRKLNNTFSQDQVILLSPFSAKLGVVVMVVDLWPFVTFSGKASDRPFTSPDPIVGIGNNPLWQLAYPYTYACSRKITVVCPRDTLLAFTSTILSTRRVWYVTALVLMDGLYTFWLRVSWPSLTDDQTEASLR